MAILFHLTPSPTRINSVQINQSNQGYPVPVVMGRGKVQQTILWIDGFQSRKVNVSGGKGFGGKEGTQYAYSADVLAALCDGGTYGLLGVGDMWAGQSWLKNNSGSETYVIDATNPTYLPANASTMVADNGVSYTVAIDATYNDIASPWSTHIATDLVVSLQRVPWSSGQTLASGTYSVDTNGKYYFSAADAGRSLTIHYSFSLRTVTKQMNAVVPSGLNIQISGNFPFVADLGVIYYDSGVSDPNNGKAFTRVSGTPTAAGTYSVDYGSYHESGPQGNETVNVSRYASYTFASADVNKEVQITYQQDVSSTLSAGTPSTIAFELINGTASDSPAALLETNYPSAALGYPGIAKLLYTPMDLGYGGQIQQNTFEALTWDFWGGGIADCNAVRCILQVLTNGIWGLGSGPIPFPTSAIDNGTDGTWGTATPTGTAQSGSTAANWFAANGFFISPVLDRQDTAASVISRWLEAGMCAAFMSEGLMKLVPFGDTSTAANGATWVAPSSFAAELDDTCFIGKSGEDPVKISSKPWTEAFNTVQISWNNRSNQYAPEVTPAKDRAAILRYGDRIEDPQSYDFITTLTAATFAAEMRLKRSVYTRNTYEFTLPYRFGHLEPMDVISITTNSAWNNAANNTIQLLRCPARITKIVDNPDGTYNVTAEDLISGAHTPDGFSKNLASPAATPNQYADPGDTTPVIVDAPLNLKAASGNELWIGAAGANANWGGCYVYASLDGNKYKQIGMMDNRGRLGTLNASFPAGSDPDTTDSLVVNLQPGSDSLDAGTQADADNAVTLCWLDGELIAYSSATISGTDQYTLSSYIRRGLMGTTAATHAQGAQFLRLDDTVFKYAYDNSWIGKTVYLKFQSFNQYGNAPQDLSACKEYSYTPAGTNYPPPPVVTLTQSTSSNVSNGLVTSSGDISAVSTVYVTVTWTWPTNYPEPAAFNVALFTGTDPTAVANYIVPIATVGASARSFTFAVAPSSSMTTVNAAVEALYA